MLAAEYDVKLDNALKRFMINEIDNFKHLAKLGIELEPVTLTSERFGELATKVGKDKLLGKLNMDITDGVNLNGKEGKWFPLSGVKTGKVPLSTDFIDKLGLK